MRLDASQSSWATWALKLATGSVDGGCWGKMLRHGWTAPLVLGERWMGVAPRTYHLRQTLQAYKKQIMSLVASWVFLQQGPLQ